jgi:hypothetical protein
VGFWCLIVALSPGRVTSWDAGLRAAVSRALWTRGTVFLPREHSAAPGLVFPPNAPGGTTFYGIGQTLAFLPFDVLGALLGRLTGREADVRAFIETLPLVFVYGPLVGVAWWWVILRLLEALGFSRALALGGSIAFVTCTIVLVYVAQTLQEEAIVGVLVTACLLATLRWGRTGAPRSAFLAGLLGASALLVRPSALVALLPALGAAGDAVARGRSARGLLSGVGLAAGGLALPLVLHGLFAWWRFGSVVSTGYELAPAGLRVAWGPIRPSLAAALLAGPGKGLLLLSPPLLLALVGLPSVWRRGPFLWSGVILALVGSVLVHSKLIGPAYPDGSESWGTRFQVHLLGFLAAPTLAGIQAARRRVAGMVLVAVLLTAGLGVQILACMAPDSLEYCQASEAGDPRPRLLLGATDGQLALRAANVWRWVRGDTIVPRGTCSEGSVARMWSRYVPNVWGPVYAKRIGHSRLGAVPLATWLIVLAAGSLLLVAGLRRAVEPGPDAEGPANGRSHGG